MCFTKVRAVGVHGLVVWTRHGRENVAELAFAHIEHRVFAPVRVSIIILRTNSIQKKNRDFKAYFQAVEQSTYGWNQQKIGQSRKYEQYNAA